MLSCINCLRGVRKDIFKEKEKDEVSEVAQRRRESQAVGMGQVEAQPQRFWKNKSLEDTVVVLKSFLTKEY